MDEGSVKLLKKSGGQTPLDEDSVKLLKKSGGQTPVKKSGGKAQVKLPEDVEMHTVVHAQATFFTT